MKPTLKSINDALPRFDAMRRHWMKQGTTGWTDGREYLQVAFADLGPDGNVTDITLYTYGGGKAPRHYYNEQHDDVIDITVQIEDAISGDRLSDYNYDAKRFRAQIVYEIQQAIIEALNEDK